MTERKFFPLTSGKAWSATFDGDVATHFDLTALTIRDVARGLAYVNRFCGAAGNASVAEHSVKLARFCGDFNPLRVRQCLLHDASEALGCADAHGGLKKLLAPAVRAFEAALVDAVWHRLVGGPPPDWSWLKPYDQCLGDWEACYYRFPNTHSGPPLSANVTPENWRPDKAYREFMIAWNLNGGV